MSWLLYCIWMQIAYINRFLVGKCNEKFIFLSSYQNLFNFILANLNIYPHSLMEGTETLCRDDIGDLLGSPDHLWLNKKKPMKLASGFCIPEPLPVYTGIKGRQVRPLIRFYAEEPRRVPCNQQWFKIVSWGHKVSVPSLWERGLRT